MRDYEPGDCLNMIIVSEWDDEAHTILLTALGEHWDWEDLHRHNAEVTTPMTLSVAHPVAIIVNLGQSLLPSLDGFQDHVRRITDRHRKLNIEMVVFVARQAEISTLLRDAHRLYSTRDQHYILAESVDRARTAIHAFRNRPASAGA